MSREGVGGKPSDIISFRLKTKLFLNFRLAWRRKECTVEVMEIFSWWLSSMWQQIFPLLAFINLSVRLFLRVINPSYPLSVSIFHFFSLFLCSVFFVFLFPLIFFWGLSVIHLPSREVFPQGKLLWRPAWPRTASDWPSACLPFCILHCLFNKEQTECDFQGRVPVIVALTPCLSNDPHYGASDSSLKGLIYEYAGTAAPQASMHQPRSMVSLSSVSTHRLYIHEAWAFARR